MKTALTVTATLALAIATGSLVAQTSGTPASTPPTGASPPSTMPQTPMPPPDVPTTPRSNMSPTGRPATAPPDFNTLDTTGVGYVTQQQATTNPWLSKNFTACDTNRDGRISRGEYAACTHQP